jgi:hemerythrin superfamily protein
MFRAVSEKSADRVRALGTLIHDHRKISGLFELLQQSDDSNQRRFLFQEIRDELRAHAQLEEDILYPRLAKFDELVDFLDDSYDEHQEMKDIIGEIDQIETEAENMDPSQITELHDELESAVEELIDVVSYHVDEEEGKLFPRILELMSVPELDRLEDALTSEVANRASNFRHDQAA